MKQSRFPDGRDEARVRRVLAHYGQQTEEEALAEDPTQTLMEVPSELVPAVRRLIASQGRTKRSTRPRPPSGSAKRATPRSGRGG